MGHRQRNYFNYDDKMQVLGEIFFGDDDDDDGPKTERRGTKRKVDVVDEDDQYTEQRRSIFSVFMCKLNHYRQVADPSLRRSVLICNTLKFIEQEMIDEGVELDPSASVPFLPPVQGDVNAILDPPPLLVDSFAHTALLMPLLECRSDADGACRRHAADPLRAYSDRLPEACEPICWSSVLNFSDQGDDLNSTAGDERVWSCDAGGQSSDAGSPNTSPSSDSGISTASDEIFGDIDVSLYDFDLLPLSPPSIVRVTTPPSAEDLLHSCPAVGRHSPVCLRHHALLDGRIVTGNVNDDFPFTTASGTNI